MNTKKINGIIALLLASTTSVMATTNYQSLQNASSLMSQTQSTVSQAIGFLGFGFGWVLLLGFPIGAYYFAYKSFKEKDEQDRSGSGHAKMLHAKSAAVALVALVAGSLIFTFIFVNTLHAGNTFTEAVRTVLKIGNAFKSHP